MARGPSHRVRTRDTVSIANDPLRFVSKLISSTPPTIQPRELLRLYEDRRTWSPDRPGVRVPRSFSRSTRLTISPDRYSARHLAQSMPPAGISFKTPRRVVMCVRRRIRREVLHALSQAGRGGQRSPRWTEWSHVNC